jgi:hypothetical protein
LKGNQLEEAFLNSLVKNLTPEINLKESSNSLLLKNKKQMKELYVYNINLDLLSKKKLFIKSFLNYSKNLHHKCVLIFHFKVSKNNQIIFYPYLMEILNNNKEKPIYGSKVNNFYNSQLLAREAFEIKDLGLLLWRLPLNANYFFLEDYSQIFGENVDKKDREIGVLIKKTFLINNIDFLEINDKMMLINKKLLFFYTLNVNTIFIKKIIQKYYDKYYIIILIINRSEYNKLISIENLKELNNLKIINFEQFKKIVKEIPNYSNPKTKKYPDQSQYLEQNNQDVI